MHLRTLCVFGEREESNCRNFAPGDLRKAGLNQGYVLANGNIDLVKAIANHVSAETTNKDYLCGPADA